MDVSCSLSDLYRVFWGVRGQQWQRGLELLTGTMRRLKLRQTTEARWSMGLWDKIKVTRGEWMRRSTCTEKGNGGDFQRWEDLRYLGDVPHTAACLEILIWNLEGVDSCTSSKHEVTCGTAVNACAVAALWAALPALLHAFAFSVHPVTSASSCWAWQGQGPSIASGASYWEAPNQCVSPRANSDRKYRKRSLWNFSNPNQRALKLRVYPPKHSFITTNLLHCSTAPADGNFQSQVEGAFPPSPFGLAAWQLRWLYWTVLCAAASAVVVGSKHWCCLRTPKYWELMRWVSWLKMAQKPMNLC